MGEVEQGKFYNVRYDNGIRGVIETKFKLRINYYYTDSSGRRFQVIGKKILKYTYDDIEAIRALTAQYDIGTVQYNISKKMSRVLKDGVPSVRFSGEERELLSYIYYEDKNLSDNEKEALEKVLGIKETKNGKQ